MLWYSTKLFKQKKWNIMSFFVLGIRSHLHITKHVTFSKTTNIITAELNF